MGALFANKTKITEQFINSHKAFHIHTGRRFRSNKVKLIHRRVTRQTVVITESLKKNNQCMKVPPGSGYLDGDSTEHLLNANTL